MEMWRWLDDARADEHGRARRRERLLRRAAEEGATIAGVLLDLAERGVTVRVRTASGRTHVGPVRLVGVDFVVVDEVWLRLDALVWVRPDLGSGGPPADGDRGAVDLRLLEALGRVAADLGRVAIVTSGGDVLTGELRSVGADVVTLRLDGADEGLAYVPGVSVLEVRRSG